MTTLFLKPLRASEADASLDCGKLTSITIGSNVKKVGEYSFFACISLGRITVDPGNSIYSSLDGILFNKNQSKLLQYPGGKVGSYTIPPNRREHRKRRLCKVLQSDQRDDLRQRHQHRS